MSLADLLRARIAAAGPMRVSEYMALCLGHPQHGYYMTRDPLGRDGDFTTAPEVSQMFGELLGLALARAWIDQGAPAPACLAELGPGRGTLMADILRATRAVPGFHDAVRLHLVETSPVLRAAQAARLGAHRPRWHGEADALPDLPLFLVANEFFDALPIRQFLRTARGWRERVVDLDAGGGLRFALAPAPDPPGRLPEAPEGTLCELRPEGERIAALLGGRLARQGGLAIVIDYGGEGGRGDTLQAVKDHRAHDPLVAPGEADLTAHVDFAALAAAAAGAGATAHRCRPQGEVLLRLGIAARAASLVRAAPARAAEIEAQLTRLVARDQMGGLFRMLALTGRGAPIPPGFEADP